MAKDPKEPSQAEKADAVETFLNGKYKSKADMESAYAELEKKLGEQGSELGTLRKQFEERDKAIQQYTQWAQQVSPVLNWFETNKSDLIKWDTERLQKKAAPTTAVNSLLTGEEQEALISKAVERANQQSQQYYTSLLQQTIAQKTQEFQKTLEEREHAQARLYWQMLEKGLPEDRVKFLKEMNQETLRYADPSKHDPMRSAEEIISARQRISELESQLKDSEKAKEEAAKQAIPSLGHRSILRKPDANAGVPSNRDERFKAVMSQLTNDFGAEGIEVLKS